MKEYLRQIDLRSKLTRANCSTEEAWTILKASIEEAVSKFVPKKMRRQRSNKPLWWNKEIYRTRRKRSNKPLWLNKEIYRTRRKRSNKPLWLNKEIYRARRKRSNKPLWWNKEIYRARKNRLRWWNRYKETKIHQDYIKLKRAEHKASRLVRQAKRKLEGEIADNIKQDPKFFYKYARSQLKVKEIVATSMLDHN